ncbi:MAG: ornithine carbamoyltransferase [Chloroflexota bacterium]
MSLLKGRHFLSVADFSTDELEEVLRVADELKRGAPSQALAGKCVALLFEHPSLRTRTTFEVGAFQLGGHAVYLTQEHIGIGHREPPADIARNLERWVHAIIARVRSHDTVQELAQWSRVPVVNALSDREHPCQVLADMQTLRERLGQLRGATLLFSGDGYNVCHSLLLVCARLGVNILVATPPAFAPRPEIVALAQEAAARNGSRVEVGHDPKVFVHQADAIYTDVWASMGQEAQAADRRAAFGTRYQVNAELLAGAQDHAWVMHDLPAHRGEEITAEVIEGPRSIVFDQAENRLHAQKALLSLIV